MGPVVTFASAFAQAARQSLLTLKLVRGDTPSLTQDKKKLNLAKRKKISPPITFAPTLFHEKILSRASVGSFAVEFIGVSGGRVLERALLVHRAETRKNLATTS